MAFQDDDSSDDSSTDTSSNGNGSSTDSTSNGGSSSDDTTNGSTSSDDGTSSDGTSSGDSSSDDSSSDESSSDDSGDDGTSSDDTSSDSTTNGLSSDSAVPMASSSSSSSSAASSSSNTAASSSSSSATNYTATVPIPSGINANLTSADPATMQAALGNPGTPDPHATCGTSSAALQKLMKTASVGPFRVTGLSPAVDALTRVFAAVKSAKPDLFAVLGNDGMLCVRFVGGSTTNLSNHSWGTAVDMTIGGVETPRGSTTVTQGLVDLAPFMAAEMFYWGAGFSTKPDGMHFEASSELIAKWKADGTI